MNNEINLLIKRARKRKINTKGKAYYGIYPTHQHLWPINVHLNLYLLVS